MNYSRRHFIQRTAWIAASVPCVGLLSQVIGPTQLLQAKEKETPLPEGKVAVSEADPVATAIGYKQNAKEIDFKKYPQRKKPEAKSQACATCALYTPENASWGKCQMLTSGLVNHKGWCGSWSKKA